ncbi:MAG: class I SAM-dependent methyltransferase [Thiotrichaceae bacterium]
MTTKAHWETIYQTKLSTEVSWHQAYPELSLQLIQKAGILPDDPIIEVGAGTATLVDCLLEQGFNQLTVLDIASTALQQTQARLSNKAEKVHWIEADVTQFQPRQRYQYWQDRAVFHFLTEAADRQSYLQVLKSALNLDGYAMIATFAADGPEQCSGLNVVRYDEQGICAELGETFTLQQVCHETHITPSGNAQKFSYFLFKH